MDEREKQAILTFMVSYLEQYDGELEAILLDPEYDKCYRLYISIVELAERNFSAASAIVASPMSMLSLFDDAAQHAQAQLMERHPDRNSMMPKDRLKVRLLGLPWSGGGSGPSFGPDLSCIRSGHVGQLVCVQGTVLRASAVHMLEVQRSYKCKKCRHRFVVQADPESQILPRPATCPTAAESGCKGKDFIEIESERLLSDYQEVRLQARTHKLAMGAMPAALTAVLTDDLVGCCQPGDDVSITAVVLRQFKPPVAGARCEAALVLHANSISVLNERKGCIEVSPEDVQAFDGFWAHHAAAPLVGRNAIIASVCSQMHGMFACKLALLLMLIGGTTRTSTDGMYIRGDIHLLLVGDPGTGKSQLMKYASQLSPRTVVASGTASSAAGLTATAVREGASWSLQAGALVLADGGLCCIDEFDGIKEADRATIHEAMEQQTVSIAKAGLLTTLNTRTSVFGVVNPRRKPGTSQAEVAPTSLSGPLLSRFDMVLMLRDMKDPAVDAMIAAHILDGHQKAGSRRPLLGWPLETLQKYIYWVKSTCHPVLLPEAEQLLMKYYQMQRRLADRHKARTTIRMLESLVRLAQAHARLMARQEVAEMDAIVAVSLTEATMQQSSDLSFVQAMNCDFDADPDATYRQIKQQLLDLVRGGAMC